MAISITLPRRSGQTNPLSSAQWDDVVGIIESAFSQVSTSTGSVTSVNATVPSGLTVSGVPITGAGTIAIGNNLSSGFVKSAGVGFGFTSSASIGLTSDVSGTLPLANGGTNKSSWTSSRIVIVNGSGALSEADTATYPSLTELSYVKGVTSDIQAQINSKEPTISILPTTKGGTGVNMPSRQDLINYLVDTTSATLNDVLYFDGANLAWTPQSVGTAGIGIGISSGIISLKNGATLTGGSVLYWDGVNSQITQDNSKLFFNGTALGVGTNSGFTKTLNVAGDARFTSNLNSAAQVDIVNSSSGNAAVSELRVLNNSSAGFSFSAYSSGYVSIGTLDIASTAFVSSGTLPMNLASDNTTGIKIWSSNGSGTFTEAVKFGNGETVFNDVGANRDFRIEGDTISNLFFVDASSDYIGIGTNTPSVKLHIYAPDDDGWVLMENDATGIVGPSLILRYGTTPAVKTGSISRNTNSLNINDTNAIVITSPINLFNNDNRVAGTLCVASSSTTINASAILQADSTTKGFLPPRMTTVQRDAIASPAAGLMIFNTTTSKANVYTGTAWDALH
jgi:hypothetical protein